MKSIRRLVLALHSATNRGLWWLATSLLVGVGLLMVLAVFFRFDWRLTPNHPTPTFEYISEEKVSALASDFPREQELIDRIRAGERPVPERWEEISAGYPVLYAWPMAYVQRWSGDRGLALINVVCTLLAMCLLLRIGTRIWSFDETVDSLSEGDWVDEVGSREESSSTDKANPQDGSETPVVATFFGILVMGIFGLNPIAFAEATDPGPRPLAYLVATLALYLSLRVLAGKPLPWFRCGVLILLSAAIHLPAVLVVVPVLLLGFFGRVTRRVQATGEKRWLRANFLKVVGVVFVAAFFPILFRVFSASGAFDFSVTQLVEQYFPASLQSPALAVIAHCNRMVAEVGVLLVNLTPQLAVLSMVPLPKFEGVVPRTMLVYAVGLLVFFGCVFPFGPLGQFYPVLVPVAILGAVGVLNVMEMYVKEAAVQLAKQWIRFFAVLGAAPVIGTAMVWLSSLSVEEVELWGEKDLGFNGLVTPYSLALFVIALIGFLWQVSKLLRRRMAGESTSSASADVALASNQPRPGSGQPPRSRDTNDQSGAP